MICIRAPLHLCILIELLVKQNSLAGTSTTQPALGTTAGELGAPLTANTASDIGGHGPVIWRRRERIRLPGEAAAVTLGLTTGKKSDAAEAATGGAGSEMGGQKSGGSTAAAACAAVSTGAPSLAIGSAAGTARAHLWPRRKLACHLALALTAQILAMALCVV